MLAVACSNPLMASDQQDLPPHYYFASADTSSPRDTLRNFLDNTRRGLDYDLANDMRKEAAFLLAAQALDYGKLPKRTQSVVTMERIMLLKAILNRIELPPWEQIPGDKQVQEQGIERWVVPNGQLVIARVEEGDRKGQYLFTEKTVNELENIWLAMRHLPYIKGAEEDLIYRFRVQPGPWIDDQLIWGAPEWTRIILLTLPLWQWLSLTVLIITTYLAAKLLLSVGKYWDKHVDASRPWRQFGKPLAILSVIGLLVLALNFMIKGLWLYGMAYQIASAISWCLIFICAAWFTLVCFDRAALALSYHEDNAKARNAPLIRVLSRIFGVITVALIVIYATEFMGFSISPLVAGLSISGLAVALAIRPLLENVISGLTLYADGGVKVGDFTKFGEQMGFIEQIGLRSTRVRTLERSVITIPNSEFAQQQLDNLEKRDKRRMRHILRLRHNTTMEQLRVILADLRKMALRHPKVEEEPFRIRFAGYGPYSLDIEFMIYLTCRDTDTFMAIQEDILFLVAELVEKSGSQIAFSSQKEYLGRTPELAADKQERASKRVETWRNEKRFPFPDFDSESKADMKGTLKYPPEGSSVADTTNDLKK
ncbi:hypothetical protein GCM10011369_06160 [Neiella marina]|uniref:Mechanosensitive ion channel family protein n=1 Tax=Neiella marina TaxID=508461 RepID=A0A8J2XMW7_9GAMM|nr:mechanosensitive ion channel family protein [Neiella marina]GGA67262.1 hypothetical protein GCM10011369_06160 [Neiella marina]